LALGTLVGLKLALFVLAILVVFDLPEQCLCIVIYKVVCRRLYIQCTKLILDCCLVLIKLL